MLDMGYFQNHVQYVCQSNENSDLFQFHFIDLKNGDYDNKKIN